MILEEIETSGYKVIVRDTVTGEPRTLRLTGSGPWDLGDGEILEVPTRATPRAAPPPDEAITLRLRCTRTSPSVRVNAVGSGAVAWADSKGTLLGAPWKRDDRGAPVALLEKSATLINDLRRALPAVTIDTAECEDADRLYSGKPAPTETEARRSAGRGQRRGERISGEDLGKGQLAALSSGQKYEPSLAEPAPAPAAAPSPTAASSDVPAPTSSSDTPTPEPHREQRKTDRRRRKVEAIEAGPGDLQWTAITEDGIDGFAAPYNGGTYKLMHVGGDSYGLFFQRDAGGYEVILCGDVDETKAAAASHMAGMTGMKAVRAACDKKPACRSPRTAVVLGVADLLKRYATRSVETAFTAAVHDGMSLCSDNGEVQDFSDLPVDRALLLLKERGEDAVYAIAYTGPVAGTVAPPPPYRVAEPSRPAPPPPPTDVPPGVAAAPSRSDPPDPPKPERPATRSTEPEKPPAPDADEELLKSFSDELESVLGEEDD